MTARWMTMKATTSTLLWTDTMQTERLLALANWLEGGAKHKLKIHGRDVVFDMAKGIQVMAEFGEDFEPNSCATACCVAGAAVEFFMPEKAAALLHDIHDKLNNRIGVDEFDKYDELDWDWEAQVGWDEVGKTAQALLGLSAKQAHMLFKPADSSEEHEYETDEFDEFTNYTDPAWAARVIRRGVATGDFNWNHPEVKP